MEPSSSTVHPFRRKPHQTYLTNSNGVPSRSMLEGVDSALGLKPPKQTQKGSEGGGRWGSASLSLLGYRNSISGAVDGR
jgi:hypothetical protein